jgi:uncharacterized protein
LKLPSPLFLRQVKIEHGRHGASTEGTENFHGFSPCFPCSLCELRVLNKVRFIQSLIAGSINKADLNARDGHGRTPLHVAVFAKQREAIKALVKAGANINLLENDRYDGITIASVADDEDTLGVLLQLGANAKLITSRYDGSALIAASHLGHDGIVRKLIAAGAPLDLVNNLHWTAVIESIVLGDGGKRHQASLEALIKSGANLQLPDRAGHTPLQLARQRGYSAMVRMLEAAGAR